MEGQKNDRIDDKLRWDLLPLDIIEKLVEVYHFGAQKYEPNTWQKLDDGENRYRGALFRHLVWNAIAILYFATEKEKKLKAHENTCDKCPHK